MRRLLPATVTAAGLLLAACSGKQAPSEPTSTDGNPTPAHGSLAECLRANGVPESSGPAAVLGPPAGVDPATWEKAMKACASFAPGPAGP